MFPKASLTGRVVRTNNTMRMAKSWGHSGGPVPAPHGRQSCASRRRWGRESGYLDSEEAIAEYLSLAARDENPGVLLKALGDVAKARGMAEVAKASGLGRESLYKTPAPGAKPRFETIATIMRALNVGLLVESRLAVRAKKARKLKAA